MKKNTAIIFICAAFIAGGILGTILGAGVYKISEEIDEDRRHPAKQQSEVIPPDSGLINSGGGTASPYTTNADGYIGEDKAKEIALNKAGISADGVYFDRVELDYDDDYGVWHYEIEFRKDRTEYDADIKADDGTILKWEKDFGD